MNARKLAITTLMLGISACAAPEEPSESGVATGSISQAATATTLQIQLPAEAPLSQLGLVGLTSLKLNNQVVVEGHTLSNAALSVGNEAKTGALWANGNITVGDRGAVNGDAVAKGTVTIPSTTTHSGRQLPNSTFTLQPRLKWSYTRPDTYTADVVANSGETKSASPARYRNLTAQGGTVKLSAGSYFIDNLTLHSGSKLEVPGDGPAPVIYVFTSLTYQGSITDSNGKGQRPVIVYLGTNASTIQTKLDFTLVAPNAAVTLAALNGGVKHRGSVIAKQLELAASAQFAARPSNALVPSVAKNAQECSDLIAPDAGLTEPARERQRLSDVARYCMGFTTSCQADLVAKVNLDYHTAALKMATGAITPAQYLALSRDRTRKRAMSAQSPTATCDAVNSDPDGDLIPTSKDNCPNTPPLTPTNDSGCTDNTLPLAPPSDKVIDAMGKITLVGSRFCMNAPIPTMPTFDSFAPIVLGWNDLVLARVGNQPAGCPVFYHVQLETLNTSTGETVRYMALFQESESQDPLSGPTVRFRVAGTNDPGRTAMSSAIYGALYTDPTHIKFVRVRTLATSGAGARSSWSSWSRWY